jgi:hypothetical protein
MKRRTCYEARTGTQILFNSIKYDSRGVLVNDFNAFISGSNINTISFQELETETLIKRISI